MQLRSCILHSRRSWGKSISQPREYSKPKRRSGNSIPAIVTRYVRETVCVWERGRERSGIKKKNDSLFKVPVSRAEIAEGIADFHRLVKSCSSWPVTQFSRDVREIIKNSSGGEGSWPWPCWSECFLAVWWFRYARCTWHFRDARVTGEKSRTCHFTLHMTDESRLLMQWEVINSRSIDRLFLEFGGTYPNVISYSRLLFSFIVYHRSIWYFFRLRRTIYNIIMSLTEIG